MPKSALDKAIAGYYSKPTKKTKKNKTTKSYEEIVKEQNRKKQEQGHKVAQEKKSSKGTTASSFSPSNPTQSSNRTSSSWGAVNKKQNEQKQSQAKKEAERKKENKSWYEKALETFEKNGGKTALSEGKTKTVSYGASKSKGGQYKREYQNNYDEASLAYGNRNKSWINRTDYSRDLASTKKSRYEGTRKFGGTVADIKDVNNSSDSVLPKMAAKNQNKKAKEEVQKQADQVISEYEKRYGITLTDDERKQAYKDLGLNKAFKEIDKATKDATKEAKNVTKENYQQVARSLNTVKNEQKRKELNPEQLKKKEFKYKGLNNAENLAWQTALKSFPGNKKAQEEFLRLQGGDELVKKVGDVVAGEVAQHPIAAGLAEGFAPVPVYKNAAGEMSDQAKDVFEYGKSRPGYGLGYAGGVMAQFGALRANVLGESLAAKVAPKVGSKAGQFLTRRVAEGVVETPLDLMDAYKNSFDEDGKFNGKEFVKQAALNAGLNFAAGSGIEGAGKAFTKRQAARIVELQGKANVTKLTAKEEQELSRLYDVLEEKGGRSNLSTDIANEGRRNAATLRDNAKVEEAVRVAKTNADNAQVDEVVRRARTAEDNAKVDRAVAKSQEGFDTGKEPESLSAEDKKIAPEVPAMNKDSHGSTSETPLPSAIFNNSIANNAGNVNYKPLKEQIDDEVAKLTEDDLKETSVAIKSTHTPEEVKRINDYISSTNKRFLGFIRKINGMENKNAASKLKFTIGDVTEREVEAVKKEASLDMTGYKHEINGSSVIHIKKGHGGEGKHLSDKSMAVDADIARAEYIMDKHDRVDVVNWKDLDDETKKAAREFKSTDNKEPIVLTYTKKIDGEYHVVQSVPDSKAKKTHIITMYEGKDPLIEDIRHKEKQLEIIRDANPSPNEYNTWIRDKEDIKTFDEVTKDFDSDYYTEDYTKADMERAKETGKITVYSSYEIKDGVFVTPSKMEALSYSGDGKVYSKEVNLDDVAWIDEGQGQYAKVPKEAEYGATLKKRRGISAETGDANASRSADTEITSSNNNKPQTETEVKGLPEKNGKRRFASEEEIESYVRSGNSKEKRKAKKAWKEGRTVAIKEGEIKEYISDVLNDPSIDTKVGYGQVSNRLADAAENAGFKISAKDKYLELSPNDLRHMMIDHGPDAKLKPGDLPLAKEDIENITEYIDDFDDIFDIKDNSFKVGKRVNGYTVITEIYSKSRDSFAPKTMWKMETDKYLADYGDQIKKQGKADVQPQRAGGELESSSNAEALASTDIKSRPKAEVNTEPRNLKDIDSDLKSASDEKQKLVDEQNKLKEEGKTDEADALNDRIKEQQEKVNELQSERKKAVKAETQKAQTEAQDKWSKMSTEERYKESKDLSVTATSTHMEKIEKAIKDDLDPDKKDLLMFEEKKGMFGKVKGMTQKDALAEAESLLEKDGVDRLYDDYLNAKVGVTGVEGQDVQLVQAKGSIVLHKLINDLNSGNGNRAELINKITKIAAKSTEIASASGRNLNAVKMMLKSTPEGRLCAVQREKDQLAKKFADRLKGKELNLSDETMELLGKDLTEDELDEALKKANLELWDQIPATAMEKFNEFRHFSMLSNPRTHIRNLTGNQVFKAARGISDGIEYALTKGMSKKLAEKGVVSEMGTRVTRQEIKGAKKGIDEHFAKIYEQSGSKSKFIERTRPDGSSVFDSKVLAFITEANYKALEWEDIVPTLRPEYRKQFIRYCKTHGLDYNNIESIAKQDLEKADKWAMDKAEYATFRDNCAFSEFLTGKKQQMAGKTGKTAVGTLGYRAGSMILDSQLPFVKTPVNIFRRSIDYSPISLIRASSELHRAIAKGQIDLATEGIHHLATGLTGTGIMALGMWAANNDIVTVEAGDVSGDAYYDRDMGYQDYSLKIGGHSITIDWVAPMQSSFFMGAVAYDNLLETQNLDEAFKGLLTLTNPMLEMSFMGTAKDTVETFIDRATRQYDGETHWTDAVSQTIFGSLPQGWISSFLPQTSYQLAKTFDPKERDTRSTKEGYFANSWDSFGKKMANRIPGLRNMILNPKLDRFGDDKETGQNIATRFINAMINPATVKKITYNDTDKEIIDIYNNMEESDDKKFYFYNFTGNPSYALYGDKGRMTYDEAYQYGKENRRTQTGYIEDMIKSASYKEMTYNLKAKEVKDAHWTATAKADWKTFGAKYAINKNILDEESGNATARNAYNTFKMLGGKDGTFMDGYIKMESFMNRAHCTDYHAKAAVIATFKNQELFANAYDVYGDKLDLEKKYMKDGGSLKELSDGMCYRASGISKAGCTDSNANGSRVLADYDVNERTYRGMGYTWNSAQAGAGLKKYGYSFTQGENVNGQKSLEQVKTGLRTKYGTSPKKDEVIDYIDSLDLDSKDEAACLFEHLAPGLKNPYKEKINDHLKWGKDRDEEWETGESSGGKGGSGRGYGGRRRGGGSGKKGKSGKGIEDWETYVGSIFGDRNTSSSGTSSSGKTTTTKISDNTHKSELDEAYRKQIKKIARNRYTA